MPVHNFRASRARCGFTLIELLVVIAIIAVLIALLLPAVQQAREAARRTDCKNKLAQISLAIHNYEMAFETLPPGCVNPTGPIDAKPEGYHMSWTVQILPYLEQLALFEHFNFKQSVYEQHEDVKKVAISVYRCPSEPNSDLLGGHPSNYAGNQGGEETPIDVKNSGVLFLNSRVLMRDIRDGSSNTILVGEKRVVTSEPFWASGTRSTLRNTGAHPNGDYRLRKEHFSEITRGQVPEVFNNPTHVGGFGSYHTGGAQFGFADGAVRFISENIDAELYSRLGQRADGKLLLGDF